MLRIKPFALAAIWAGHMVIAMAILVIATAMPATAETVFPPGLRIGLTPPSGMTASTRFSGFEDAERRTAITVVDMPAVAYEALERSIFTDKQNGVENFKRESFPFENGIGFLASGVTTEDGVRIHKWFLMSAAVAGPVRDLAMLVSFQVPEESLKVYSEEVVRKTLRSVTFRPAPVNEQLGLLPFKIGDMAGFRIMQVLPAGGVILIDGEGADINSQSYMIVSVGRGAPNDEDRARFALEMLSSAPLRNLRQQSSEALRISNGAGHEIRAQAESVTGQPVRLVQWVRFGGNGFLRVVGVASEGQWDAMFTRFRAVRDSVDAR